MQSDRQPREYTVVFNFSFVHPTPRMSYRRREIPGVSMAESPSKTERLAAVSSIRLVRWPIFHHF
jgi:hypothetical protein